MTDGQDHLDDFRSPSEAPSKPLGKKRGRPFGSYSSKAKKMLQLRQQYGPGFEPSFSKIQRVDYGSECSSNLFIECPQLSMSKPLTNKGLSQRCHGYDQLYAVIKTEIAYCMPGKSSFYDDIPLHPRVANETADYLLSNLLTF